MPCCGYSEQPVESLLSLWIEIDYLPRKTNKNIQYNLNSKGNVFDWKAYLTDMQYKFKYAAEGVLGWWENQPSSSL